MNIGERIKEAISKSGINPEKIAADAEMSVANLYRIYKRDSIETRYLTKISQSLGLPYSYFLEEEPNPAVFQQGIGNQAGMKNKQKIINGSSEQRPITPDTKVVQLEAMLKVCEAEKAGLEKLLAAREEMIEVLKGKM